MNTTLPRRTLLQVNTLAALFFVMVVMSFIGGYIENFNRPIYQAISIVTAGTSMLFAIYLLIKEGHLRINIWFFLLSSFVLAVLIIGIGVNARVTLYPFFAITCISIIYAFKQGRIGNFSFLKLVNGTFLIYLFLSLLVYLKLIPVPPILNAFEFNIMGIHYMTFIGLKGSTASIDSYAMIVALFNFLNRKKGGNILVMIIAFAASMATLRLTPVLIIVMPIVILFITKWLPRKLMSLALVPYFVSFLVPHWIHLLLNNEFYDQVINFALTGRAFLWRDMIEIYSNSSIFNVLLGFGVSETFQVWTWNHPTANPHNFFFAVLINHGLILYLLCCLLLMRIFPKLDFQSRFFVVAILTAGIGNSVILGFTNFAIVIFFLSQLKIEKTKLVAVR